MLSPSTGEGFVFLFGTTTCFSPNKNTKISHFLRLYGGIFVGNVENVLLSDLG